MGKNGESCEVTYTSYCVMNSAPTYKAALCFKCGKKYDIKSERDRKMRKRLHKKVCPNGELITFK